MHGNDLQEHSVIALLAYLPSLLLHPLHPFLKSSSFCCEAQAYSPVRLLMTRSSATAEGLRNALVCIEKSLTYITVAAIIWLYGISLPVCGLSFQHRPTYIHIHTYVNVIVPSRHKTDCALQKFR